MEYTYIPREMWMMIPAEERGVLIEYFKLEKSGYTEVHDNHVVSDGYTTDNLRAISREAMAEYVGSAPTESFLRLWELTVAKARSIVNPPMGTIEGGVVQELTVPESDTSVTKPAHAPVKKARSAKK